MNEMSGYIIKKPRIATHAPVVGVKSRLATRWISCKKLRGELVDRNCRREQKYKIK
jgi:hypothetical protein